MRRFRLSAGGSANYKHSSARAEGPTRRIRTNTALRTFRVPPEARWLYLKSMAPQPTIGQLVDEAMTAIDRDNPSLVLVRRHNTFRSADAKPFDQPV